MFIPFLAATAVATAFAQLGAMSVKIGILTTALEAMSLAFLAAALCAIALYVRTRRGALH